MIILTPKEEGIPLLLCGVAALGMLADVLDMLIKLEVTLTFQVSLLCLAGPLVFAECTGWQRWLVPALQSWGSGL